MGPPNTFCLENALKKLLNIFSNFFSYLKVQSFMLKKKNNFIQIYFYSVVCRFLFTCLQFFNAGVCCYIKQCDMSKQVCLLHCFVFGVDVKL